MSNIMFAKITTLSVARPPSASYVALKSLLQTTSNTIQTQLGLSPGQNVQTMGTVRNYLSRAAKVLLGLYAGNESEQETYGFSVVVGTAASPSSTPALTH